MRGNLVTKSPEVVHKKITSNCINQKTSKAINSKNEFMVFLKN